MIRSVLVVDDDADIRKIVSVALTAIAGWQVLYAASGFECIVMAEAHKPDVILLDVMMPSMDGPSTLALLRHNPATKGIAVIFMTAKVRPDEIGRLESLSARGVIQKPFDPMLLSTDVRRLVGDSDQ